jgi:hypothetical protein
LAAISGNSQCKVHGKERPLQSKDGVTFQAAVKTLIQCLSAFSADDYAAGVAKQLTGMELK